MNSRIDPKPGRRPRSREGLLRSIVPVIAALVAMVAACVIAYLIHLKHIDSRSHPLLSAGDRIQKQIEAHETVLGAVKGLLLAEGAMISRTKLASFLNALPASTGTSNLQGIGLALGVATPSADIARQIAARDYADAPAPWPATDQSMRYPIVLLEPQDERNRRAISYDMFSEPVRRDAMQRAAASRRLAVTAPIRLVQEDSGAPQSGVLLYLPIFHDEGVAAIPGAGNGTVMGFVYAPVRVGDLVRRVLSTAPAPDVTVAVLDAAEGGLPIVASDAVPAGAMTVQVMVGAGDRQWQLAISETRPLGMLQDPGLYVLLLGLVGAFLFGSVARAHFRELDMIDRLAQESIARAEANEVLLGEMQHRIKNSIARKLALFRLSVRETSDRQSLVQVFEQRMQALARAQDVLTSKNGAGQTIEMLLGDEIGNWRKANPGILISGPDVALDLHQSQALALIFHELTTNSLKYGAIAANRALSVTWKVTPEGERRQVELDWIEEIPTDPVMDSATGFGSRLIRLMAEGQLGGTSERSLTPGRLRLRFRFPLDAAAA